ncbi:MAG: exodeoxyribonuclease VII small subunit [Bacillota bacterium]|nr:exodeoxyribonuclease VII small subunit [Bacillota bacterium]
MKDNKIEKMSYEEAVKRLEEIVNSLENAEIPLEESLKAFQEGIALSRYCREKLADIECRVEYLLKEEQKAIGTTLCNDQDVDSGE